MHWLDILVMVMYFSGLALMGVHFSRKNTSTEEYFVGSRSFSGWVIGISLVGTAVSSITFLAYPADAFKTTWIRFTPNFVLLIAVFIAAYVFLPFFRRGKITSAYEYLEDRFGPSIRVYGALTFIFSEIIRTSIILYLLSLVIHEITGINTDMAIVIAGAFVAIYTVIGGIDTVIWTDVIQVIVFVLGGILCLGVIIHALPGGLEQIFSVALSESKIAFAEMVDGQVKPVSWDISFHQKTATMMLVYGLFNWLKHYCANQTVIQRYVSVKSDREARKAMFLAAFIRVPVWAFFFFLGTSLYVYFQVFPVAEAAKMLSGELKAEQVLPFFIINYLPPGLSGLVLAAALAAAMSSLDSSINAISTVSIVDIYRRHLVKKRDDKHYLHMAFLFATVSGILMIVGAIILLHTETRTIEHAAIVLVSIFTGGMLGIYLLGFLTKKGDARAVGVGIVFSIIFTIWIVLSDRQVLPEALTFPFEIYYTAILVNTAMFIVGYFTALLFPKRTKDLRNLTLWK